MTRSQFILGIALLCVSGTLAFFISFREHDNKRAESNSVESTTDPSSTATSSRRIDRSTPLPLSSRNVEKMDPTIYEVTVSDISLHEVGQQIERETRERLQQMTERYQLTPNQRREVFPLLVSHHPDFQEGIIVNGFVAGNPDESNLASDLYPLLDLTQQEAYQEDLLADNEWWGEIIGQLRADLDGALESGEVEVVTEPIDTLPESTGRDDGDAVENEGVDLDNFFGN